MLQFISSVTSFLFVTSLFSNKHPLEMECSYSVGGAFIVCKSNVSTLTIIVRDRAEQWVCLQCSITVGFFLNDDVTERKHSNDRNNLHWVKNKQKESKNT